MPTWSKMNLPDSATPIMQQLTLFHDHTMMLMSMVLVTVSSMMMYLSKNKIINRTIKEQQALETTWTILPAMILVTIALPSLKILYMMEELLNPTTSIKTMGHQWYWTYEYSDKKKIEIESYMEKKKSPSMFRLMDVDNRTIMPLLTQIRMIVSSSDVIHSWTIPSTGTKIDAIPGRLNQLSMIIKIPGVYFGQCSEICGSNHSFMPISIEAIQMKLFTKWMET
nr:cytochrome c oxidase subunit II [Borysthenes sp. 1 WQW-2023a]